MLSAVLGWLLVAAPGVVAATQQVAPGGSLASAYAQSGPGDVIELAPGTHGPQEIPAGSKSVTVRAAPGTKVRTIDNYADNVTFDGVDVDPGFAVDSAFENHDASNVTFKNGRIGNVTDEKGALVSGSNFTFDNVVFHDVLVTNSSVHNECVYAIGVPGMTVRNSTFQNCATMDLFFTYGDWWSPLPPAYGNVTLENNVFGHTYKDDGTWHYYSLVVGHTGPQSEGWGTISGWVVRNNTFEITAGIGDKTSTSGSRWVGNVGDWTCIAGMTFRYNVGKKCGATDRGVSPASSSAPVAAPFGFVNPALADFRLVPGSAAIDAADPADHPALDRDGLVRDARPDAGAHEYGAKPPGGPLPLVPGAPGARAPKLRRARLGARVICKRPVRPARRGAGRRRRACPRVAKLRLAVSAPARVSVRLVRLRKGKKPRRVRLVRRQVNTRATLRFRARRLRRGRYRIVVVARSSDGLESAPKRLRLRVR